METTAHSTFSVYFLSPDTETNTLSLLIVFPDVNI